jgi:hypothetical protein
MRRENRHDQEGPEEGSEYEDDELDGGLEVEEYMDADSDASGQGSDPGFFEDDFDEEDEGGEDLLPDDGDEGEADSSEDGAARSGPARALDSVRLRAKALSATVLAQARGVELPGAPEGAVRRYGTVAAIVVVSLLAGTAAFFLAKSSGEDVGQATLEGEAAGKQAGAIEGAAQGYSAGFQKGRREGFRNAYVPAYRLYYKRGFEQAGLDVPTNRQFQVPLP